MYSWWILAVQSMMVMMGLVWDSDCGSCCVVLGISVSLLIYVCLVASYSASYVAVFYEVHCLCWELGAFTSLRQLSVQHHLAVMNIYGVSAQGLWWICSNVYTIRKVVVTCAFQPTAASSEATSLYELVAAVWNRLWLLSVAVGRSWCDRIMSKMISKVIIVLLSLLASIGCSAGLHGYVHMSELVT